MRKAKQEEEICHRGIKADQEQMRIFTELIWRNWRLLFYGFNSERGLILWPDFVEESEKVLTEELTERIREHVSSKNHPVVYTEAETSMFYWGFFWEDTCYLLGPMHAQPLSFSEERGYLHRRKIKRRDFPLKECTIAESFSVISLIYFVISGSTFTEKNILDPFIIDWQQFQEEMVFQRIDWSAEAHTHLPYQFERKWYQAIRDGKGNFRTQEEEASLIDRVGVLAKGSALKQMEYMNVAQITLAARAAIDGGVPPMQAYQMSDLFMQKCSQCREAVELLSIGNQASNSFARLVREYREKNTKDPHVEMCKDYLAKHLTQKISMTRMAEGLGISYSHLASKFRRLEGVSIKKYLIREKLHAAANQLKYSEADVGEIAEYLGFSSASSMCASFKEHYGMTPLEFRRRNQVIDFV